MKKLVILLSVFTLTACSTQTKPVKHKEKPKVVKVKKEKTTKASSSSSLSSSSSSSTAPSSSSDTQTQTAPVEQAQPQSQPDGYYTAPVDGVGPTQAQLDQAQAQYGYTPGYGGISAEEMQREQNNNQASQQWHDDQVQWAKDQGLIDQNGNPTNGQ